MKTITRIVALILMTISSFTVVSQTNKISQEIIRSDFGYIVYDENKIPYEVNTTFNISFLKNGTYNIRIKDSENKVHYQKLIKQ